MRKPLALVVFALLVVATLLAQSPTLVVHRSANLREAASTESAVVAKLAAGDELTLLASAKTARFYHVRTKEGREGWVYETLVHVEERHVATRAAVEPDGRNFGSVHHGFSLMVVR